jgi:hypothetical protein
LVCFVRYQVFARFYTVKLIMRIFVPLHRVRKELAVID